MPTPVRDLRYSAMHGTTQQETRLRDQITASSQKTSLRGKGYEAYTGILKEEVGETISCVGYIGKVGMHQTDKEIIKMMLG